MYLIFLRIMKLLCSLLRILYLFIIIVALSADWLINIIRPNKLDLLLFNFSSSKCSQLTTVHTNGC